MEAAKTQTNDNITNGEKCKEKKEQRKLCRALRERRGNDKEKQRAMDRREGGWGIK